MGNYECDWSCCSSKKGKEQSKINQSQNQPPVNHSLQTMDYQNINLTESNIQQNNNVKPELNKYSNSMFLSKTSESNNNNKKGSFFSSGKSEEEIIIRGEINNNLKDKDFFNTSLNPNQIINTKENANMEQNKGININTSLKSKFSDLPLSSINSVNINESNTMTIGSGSQVTKYNLNEVYNINGQLIPGHIIYNNIRGNPFIRNMTNSKKSLINISLHESNPRIDSYMHMPKRDDQVIPEINV